jgi:hypothetical protein
VAIRPDDVHISPSQATGTVVMKFVHAQAVGGWGYHGSGQVTGESTGILAPTITNNFIVPSSVPAHSAPCSSVLHRDDGPYVAASEMSSPRTQSDKDGIHPATVEELGSPPMPGVAGHVATTYCWQFSTPPLV